MDNKKKYLFKVRQFSVVYGDYRWYIFISDFDPFHIMGEYYFRAFEHIESMSFSEYTDKDFQFWLASGAKLIKFYPKYKEW